MNGFGIKNNNRGKEIYKEEDEKLKENLKKIDDKIVSVQQAYNSNLEDAEDYRGDYEHIQYFNEIKGINASLQKELNLLNSARKNPYFGHLFLNCKDGDEDLYIGYKSVYGNRNQIVYDWRSPVCSVFYANQNLVKYKSYEYKVKIKRQIMIDNSKILSVKEIYNQDMDKEMMDEFLKEILEKRKNIGGFKDIIKSIQYKQNDIIRENINTSVLCQGVAGSGKTVIIIHRLSYILYNHSNINVNKFLFIAPNENFKKELSMLNRELQIDQIKLLTLYEYYIDKINNFLNMGISNGEKLQIKKIVDDSNIDVDYEYSAQAVEDKYTKIENDILENLDSIFKQYNLQYDHSDNLVNICKKANIIIKEKLRNGDKHLSKVRDYFEQLILKIDKELIKLRIENDDLYKCENNNIEQYIKEKLLKSKDKLSVLVKSKKNNNDSLKQIRIDINNKEEYEKLRDSLLKKLSNLRNRKGIYNLLIFNRNGIENKIEKYSSEISRIDQDLESINKSIANEQKIVKKIEVLKKNINEIENKIENINKFDSMLQYYYTINSFLAIDRIKNTKVYRYICECIDNSEYKPDEKIINLLNDINEELEILSKSNYILDSNNKNTLLNTMVPRNIIFRCFNQICNGQYLSRKNLKNYQFQRIDIYSILYIINKIGYLDSFVYSYLYIDEAQDYNDLEIKLINDLENNPVMNVFGDYKQNISSNSKIRENWDSLNETFKNKFKYYELIENYRNTTNVVNYCNETLGSNMMGIGITGKNVVVKKFTSISKIMDLALKNDAVIITKNEDYIKEIRSKTHLKIMTPFDSKGLEFPNVIVVLHEFTENEKYVSFTRSLGDLTIYIDE